MQDQVSGIKKLGSNEWGSNEWSSNKEDQMRRYHYFIIKLKWFLQLRGKCQDLLLSGSVYRNYSQNLVFKMLKNQKPHNSFSFINNSKFAFNKKFITVILFIVLLYIITSLSYKTVKNKVSNVHPLKVWVRINWR